MYGSESWVLNSTLLSSLESFQSELGKHILKLPKHTSNSIPLLVLNWPSVGARILCNKLSFLIRSSQDQSDSLKSQVFNSLATSDVMSTSIMKQCKFLDEKLGSDFTNKVLSQPQTSQRKLKEIIVQFDRKRTLTLSEGHPSLEFVLEAARRNIWLKFWDTALDHGESGTKASLSILKLLCMTVFNDRNCPSEGCDFIVPKATPLCTHFIRNHTNLPPETTPNSLIDLIISSCNGSEHFQEILQLGLRSNFGLLINLCFLTTCLLTFITHSVFFNYMFIAHSAHYLFVLCKSSLSFPFVWGYNETLTFTLPSGRNFKAVGGSNARPIICFKPNSRASSHCKHERALFHG